MAHSPERGAPGDAAAARHRAVLRARVEICAALHGTGGGAALAAALRLGEEAAAELTRIPDTPALRRRDEAALARGSVAPDGFAAAIRRLAEEYRGGRALDLFTASPSDLLASCLARAAL